MDSLLKPGRHGQCSSAVRNRAVAAWSEASGITWFRLPGSRQWRGSDSIVRRGRDPALLEQVGRELFRLSVFPLLPEQPTVVELNWIEAIPLVDGELHYVYPLASERGNARTEEDFTMTVKGG